MEEYIEIKDMANQMKVSPHYLYRLINTRKFPIPYTRFGDGRGVIRIKQSDLDKYLESREVVNE